MFENCTPRGRWVLAKYVKSVPVQDKRLYLYEVLNAGSGVTDLAAGDIVVVLAPDQVVEVENERAFIWRDYVVATWNDTLELANPIAPFMRGDRVYGTKQPVTNWYSDALIVSVTDVPPEVDDISIGDEVIVPARYAWLAGPNAQGTFLFHPDHVVGTCA